jgi:hypothetical protein
MLQAVFAQTSVGETENWPWDARNLFAIEERLESYRGRDLREFVALKLGLTRVPMTVFTFSHLTALNLSKNNLRELPREIGLLKHLWVLVLKRNCLTRLPTTIGELQRLGGIDLRDNDLCMLPWSFCRLRCCDIYLSGNPRLPFDDDIYCDHDEQICSLLKGVAKRYSCGGAREAIVQMCLIHKLRKDSVLARLPRCAFRSVLLEGVWSSRYEDEWIEADQLAFREDIDLAPLREHFIEEWVDG